MPSANHRPHRLRVEIPPSPVRRPIGALIGPILSLSPQSANHRPRFLRLHDPAFSPQLTLPFLRPQTPPSFPSPNQDARTPTPRLTPLIQPISTLPNSASKSRLHPSANQRPPPLSTKPRPSSSPIPQSPSTQSRPHRSLQPIPFLLPSRLSANQIAPFSGGR